MQCKICTRLFLQNIAIFAFSLIVLKFINEKCILYFTQTNAKTEISNHKKRRFT